MLLETPRRRSAATLTALLAVASLVLAGCGSSTKEANGGAGSGPCGTKDDTILPEVKVGRQLAVREVTAESGYLTATTTEQGFAGSSTDLLALPRLIVDGRDTIGGFVARLRAAEGARQLARRGPLEAVRRLRAGPDGSVR